MSSHAPAKFVFICFFALTCLLLSAPGYAQTFAEAGFTSELITTLPVYQPVGLGFAPDGRLFIWQENGIVRVYKNGSLLTTPFINISDHVNTVNDRGLLGLTFDPDFTTNGFIYLFYSYEPNGNPNDGGAKTGRVTRIKADPGNPDVALAGETIILGKLTATPCAPNTDCLGHDRDAHTGGTIRFGPDRKLYVSTGDSAAYNFPEELAFRSLNQDYLNGKILRINADGTAPNDNPFYDGTNSVKSKVFSSGLRNPYRFAIHPTSGEILIGEVGWSAYEEINRATRGANFGWPCFEGDAVQATFASTFPATCNPIPASSITKPLYFYPHSEGQAIIGGTIYTASQFPAKFKDSFFFGDYPSQWIKRVVFDANRNFLRVEPFATNVGTIVSLEQGPDGSLYYIELETGRIKRIRFASAPNAVASATPTSGNSPLTVTLSSAGSSDPNNLALSYAWDFGDGSTSTSANPVHTYTSSVFKTFTATLKVTNSSGGSSSTTVAVSVGNRPPVATISAPVNGFTAKPGETISYTGTASDPDESLGTNSMSWQVLLHHDTHVHPFNAVTGSGGSFVVENHGTAGTYYYEIILTVTDSKGASVSKSANVNIAAAGTPSPTTYLSDLNWIEAFNGWGDIERDRSNGENAPNDGKVLTLAGKTYTKGLGVHADSNVAYNLNGAYSTFTAEIGVDDEVGANGSVIFQVLGDDVILFESGIFSGASATQIISVDVRGKKVLRLKVLPGTDGNGYDHADWADAKLLTQTTSNIPPVVSLSFPVNNANFNAPATIQLSASASDADGTIARVEFYQGATLLGSDTTAPYNFTWNNIAGGNYAFTAKAIDDKGAVTTSAVINVTVKSNVLPTVSVTAPANNASFTALASITINANAVDSDGSISRVEFYQGTTLLGSDTTAPYSFIWNNIAVGNYQITAVAFDNLGAKTTSTVINLSVTNLPAGWRNQDIGNPALRGSTNFSAGVFTLSASGADIWDYADSFHFAWQSFTGDGQITARVISLDNTNAWAKAGVMIRDSLTAASVHGMMVVTPNNGAAFQWRLTNPGNMGNRNSTGITAPYWVRVVRRGNLLTGYRSSNGTTWTLVSSQTITNLSATAYFGLAATSHNDGVRANVKFDNVTISK